MDLTLHNFDPHQIRRYDATCIQIQDKQYRMSLIVSADEIIHPWQVSRCEQLTQALIQPLIEAKPQVCVVGTGESLVFPTPEIMQHFIKHQITPEFMDTAAACRTFNVLLSEGRKVIVGLMLNHENPK